MHLSLDTVEAMTRLEEYRRASEHPVPAVMQRIKHRTAAITLAREALPFVERIVLSRAADGERIAYYEFPADTLEAPRDIALRILAKHFQDLGFQTEVHITAIGIKWPDVSNL